MSTTTTEPAPRLWNKPSLRLEEIVVDPDVQSRAALDEAAIELYAEALRDPTRRIAFPSRLCFTTRCARSIYSPTDFIVMRHINALPGRARSRST